MKNKHVSIMGFLLLSSWPDVLLAQLPTLDVLRFFEKHGEASCASQCLVSVMNYWGMDITESELKSMLGPVPKEGYSLSLLKNRAEFLGFRAFLFSGSMSEIAKHCAAGRPCIIAYQTSSGQNHAVVVFDVQPGLYGDYTVKILDPNELVHGIQPCGFKPIWSGWTALGSPVLLIGKEN